MLLAQANALESGTPQQRLAYVVLVSELDSPEAGVEALEALHESVESGALADIPEGYDRLLETVGGLLFARAAGETAPTPSEADQAALGRALGVYGDYLLANATDDTNSLQELERQFVWSGVGIVGALVWFLLAGFTGFVLLILFIALAVQGRLRLRFAPDSGPGSVYLETFALWFLSFIGLSLVLPFVSSRLLGVGLDEMSQSTKLLVSMVTMFLSLVTLCWPVVRGVRFGEVCRQIGLGRCNLIREMLAGFATYCASLPLLLVGVILFLVLSTVWFFAFGAPAEPSHPIQDNFGSGPAGILLVYLLACVAAPIVEEIMFRGVFYRYLRDQSARLMWIASFALSALVSSFVFAIIHPQGVLFVPILGGLAVGFCIGREWRDSLVAPMVAHAINNAVVVTLNVVING